MNLHKFINHRPHCPLCKNTLVTGFLSYKRRIYSDDSNSIVSLNSKIFNTNQFYRVFFNLTAHSPSKDNYRFSINFDQFTNYFFIDFYRKYFPTSNPLNSVPVPLTCVPSNLIFMLTKFLSLVKPYNFYSSCSTCSCYHSVSNSLNLNITENKMSDINTEIEFFSFRQEIHNQYLNIKVKNNYIAKTSTIYYYKLLDESSARWGASQVNKIVTPLIQYSDNLLNKLNKIILLS